ncbi:MAG: hypothetical protein M3O36_03465 [Myxococcota bacterium]|nr:hypothetical protein [Myxococcota bacterium]
MDERRTKRSTERLEALQFLVETVADRSGVRAVVLVDEGGGIVAGMGRADEIVGLARSTRDVAWRRATPKDVDTATRGRDVTARTVATRDGLLYLGALGDRMVGVGDAVRAVQRTLVQTGA